ncbi:hypothetical protein CDAR_6261 [Caerostris darwini]|uniref:Uncharacterized protein n=1 Tax=Caerostris darwini TaxID=1538125 RepID=A0AAV4MX94_9ARAC|nr:hypothetical protein CDAR_6261 [Caerostris darwini]
MYYSSKTGGSSIDDLNLNLVYCPTPTSGPGSIRVSFKGMLPNHSPNKEQNNLLLLKTSFYLSIPYKSHIFFLTGSDPNSSFFVVWFRKSLLLKLLEVKEEMACHCKLYVITETQTVLSIGYLYSRNN